MWGRGGYLWNSMDPVVLYAPARVVAAGSLPKAAAADKATAEKAAMETAAAGKAAAEKDCSHPTEAI